jgi:hypothetical protein
VQHPAAFQPNGLSQPDEPASQQPGAFQPNGLSQPGEPASQQPGAFQPNGLSQPGEPASPQSAAFRPNGLSRPGPEPAARPDAPDQSAPQQGDLRQPAAPEPGEPAARPQPGPLPSRQPRPSPRPAPFSAPDQPPPAFPEPGQDTAGASALPSRRGTAPETPAPRREESAVEATAEWNFGTDEGWKAVQAVSQSAPATFTSAGLPRRRRGEQLLPGSAGPPTGATAPRPQRDAHDVRGRLRSFQQGIERGRHRTARAETNHETLEGE